MTITAHTLVKNEENFVWYAVNSILPFVDEMLIWDTGSTDKTVEIIKKIKSNKIKFKSLGCLSPQELSEARNEMILKTKSDWIFILDGDEIWHDDSIKNVVNTINNLNPKIKILVSPNYMSVGDMYHYQDEIAGKYIIGKKEGHYNIRLMRNFKGLHIEGDYPDEAYVNDEGIKIQNLSEEKIYFTDDKYLHASFLPRSSVDFKKIKYEVGNNFPKDYFYPEVFFRNKPDVVKSPWEIPNFKYRFMAKILTPLKKAKRKLLYGH